jgi:3D (Asp-Asp-Asp) domain-containing protein
MQLIYRPAVEVSIRVGSDARVVRTTAGSVAELLADQRIGLGAFDRVEPHVNAALSAGTVVRVTRIDAWTAHERRRIAPNTERRTDASLAPDSTLVLDSGSPGERDVVVRYERRDGGKATGTVLASHLLRAPRPKIVARGVAAYTSLARVAEQGFASAVRLAGSALHMIATAYTAGCYGCSGVTASGLRAGLGIIAVDPSVIPLGTKLFIPGYGRAIAGDTGGAIVGHRIDLGFNNNGEALRWGRRPVTVYVLR